MQDTPPVEPTSEELFAMLDAHRAKLREATELSRRLVAESERLIAVLEKRLEEECEA